MPDDPNNGALVPLSPELKETPTYPLHHSLKPPISPRLSICWSRGNSLRVSIFRLPSSSSEPESGGEVVEVKLSGRDGDISDSEWRRIAYGSVSPFAMLQSRRNSVSGFDKMNPSPYHVEWYIIFSKLRIFLINHSNEVYSPSRVAVTRFLL